MTACYSMVESPLGPIILTSDGAALTGLYFSGQRYAPQLGNASVRRDELKLFTQAGAWLDAYFAGRSVAVDLPLAPHGTPFQRRVWQQIADIPIGETVTYAELAKRSGSSTAARAAGAATGRNPISLMIPCHRVVGSDGSLTGYAGGLERKRWLLAMEARRSGARRRDGSAQFNLTGI